MSGDFRVEHDTLGEVMVGSDNLWKAQTQRAVENFPISGTPLESEQVRALALIKQAAAKVNAELGVLPSDVASAIEEAAAAVATGDYDAHFPIDVFQTGSGTSSNMNVNEVIASLASNIRVRTSIPTTPSTPASRATTSSPPPSIWPPPVRSPTTWCPPSSTCRPRSSESAPSSPTSSSPVGPI